MTPGRLLDVEGACKAYGAVRALEEVTLSLGPGEFVALLGPNGAGKTTLFQLLTGLFVPDRGRIAIDGLDIRRHLVAALARMGVVFQQPTLDLDLTVAANLRFHARLHGLSRRRTAGRIAAELARVGLTEEAARPCRVLSGGNRRKVELARALLHEPRILLMDEPTVGLDPGSRRALLDDVHALCRDRGLGVLWATHLTDEAERADRVLVLHRGHLVSEGRPAELVSRTGQATLADAFLTLTAAGGPDGRRPRDKEARMDPSSASRGLGAFLLAASLALPALGAARDTGYVFVSSEKDNVVTVLDGRTLEKVAAIKTGARPRHLQLSADRKLLYVAASDADAIQIIDVASLKVVDSLKVGEDPEAFDLSPDGKLVFVSNEDDAELTIFDAVAKKKVATIKVGQEPEGVLAHPDGSTVYVTSEVANMVHVVDVTARKVAANVLVGNRPRRMALSPDRKELWVSNELSGSVSLIDTATHKVIGEVRFEPKGFRRDDVTPVGLTMTRDGKTAYVGLGRANHVAVVNVTERKVVDYVLVGRRAWGVALTRDEKTLYVANGLSADMSVVDTATRKVRRSLPVGRVPYGVVVDD